MTTRRLARIVAATVPVVVVATGLARPWTLLLSGVAATALGAEMAPTPNLFGILLPARVRFVFLSGLAMFVYLIGLITLISLIGPRFYDHYGMELIFFAAIECSTWMSTSLWHIQELAEDAATPDSSPVSE